MSIVIDFLSEIITFGLEDICYLYCSDIAVENVGNVAVKFMLRTRELKEHSRKTKI